MEKKALLAVVLSTIVFVVFQLYLGSTTPKKKRTTAATQEEKYAVVQKNQAIPQENKSQGPGAEPVPTAPLVTVPTQEVIIDTGITKVILTNKGARISGLSLQEFVDKQGVNINLIRGELSDRLPISLDYANENLSWRINNSNFTISDGKSGLIALSQSHPDEKIRFVFEDTSGVRVIKEYVFHYMEYLIDASISVEDVNKVFGDSPARFIWGSALNKDSGDSYSYSGPTLLQDNKLITDAPDNPGEENVYESGIQWAALQSKYFMAALIPKTAGRAKGFVKKVEKEKNEVGLEVNTRSGEAGEFAIYAGPKQEDLLKSYGFGLESIIDYGWFDFIAKPLFSVLKIFYRYTQNYGIAIILVTIIIKMIFYPLSQKSFVSMKRMQKIQPYMKVLQERYKDDKTKLNAEMMSLYKEHKVNPLGGCLPNIIQIPVFFGLYRVLLSAIELRQAPFFFWITDLAEKDPYYITPLLMGATMFLQQRMTPSTGDATQAKVMMFMPIIFTVMFLNFPSGLVLYWLVNNALTIGQQYLVQREV